MFLSLTFPFVLLDSSRASTQNITRSRYPLHNKSEWCCFLDLCFPLLIGREYVWLIGFSWVHFPDSFTNLHLRQRVGVSVIKCTMSGGKAKVLSKKPSRTFISIKARMDKDEAIHHYLDLRATLATALPPCHRWPVLLRTLTWWVKQLSVFRHLGRGWVLFLFFDTDTQRLIKPYWFNIRWQTFWLESGSFWFRIKQSKQTKSQMWPDIQSAWQIPIIRGTF